MCGFLYRITVSSRYISVSKKSTAIRRSNVEDNGAITRSAICSLNIIFMFVCLRFCFKSNLDRRTTHSQVQPNRGFNPWHLDHDRIFCVTATCDFSFIVFLLPPVTNVIFHSRHESKLMVCQTQELNLGCRCGKARLLTPTPMALLAIVTVRRIR